MEEEEEEAAAEIQMDRNYKEVTRRKKVKTKLKMKIYNKNQMPEVK